jgi:nitrite reductase (NADH) small subunit
MNTQMANELNSNEIDVCALTDLTENAGTAALVDDIQIALFYVKRTEQVFALSNYDPFSEANVLSRGIIGSIGDELVVASPIYKQHFNLETGQCVEDEAVSITAYPTQILDGRVLLGLAS